MTNEKNETNSKITPNKALRNLNEVLEVQSKRISQMEQLVMELASRVSTIEGSELKVRSFQ